MAGTLSFARAASSCSEKDAADAEPHAAHDRSTVAKPSSSPGGDCPESPFDPTGTAAIDGAGGTVSVKPVAATPGASPVTGSVSGKLTKPKAKRLALGAEPTAAETSEPAQEETCMLLDGGILYQPRVRGAVFDALSLPDLLRMGATRRILRGWVTHEMPSRNVRPADVAAGCHVEVLQRLVQTHNHANTWNRVPRGLPRMRRSLSLAAGQYSIKRGLVLRDIDLRAAPSADCTISAAGDFTPIILDGRGCSPSTLADVSVVASGSSHGRDAVDFWGSKPRCQRCDISGGITVGDDCTVVLEDCVLHSAKFDAFVVLGLEDGAEDADIDLSDDEDFMSWMENELARDLEDPDTNVGEAAVEPPATASALELHSCVVRGSGALVGEGSSLLLADTAMRSTPAANLAAAASEPGSALINLEAGATATFRGHSSLGAGMTGIMSLADSSEDAPTVKLGGHVKGVDTARMQGKLAVVRSNI